MFEDTETAERRSWLGQVVAFLTGKDLGHCIHQISILHRLLPDIELFELKHDKEAKSLEGLGLRVKG